MNYDILTVDENTTKIKMEGNEFQAQKSLSITRTGVRRFENGRIYQTSRLGEASLDRLITDTKEWGGPGVVHDFGFAPAHKEQRKGSKADTSFMKRFQDRILELRSKYPDFVFGGSVQTTTNRLSLKSDYGLDLTTEGENVFWDIYFQRKDSGNMVDGWGGGLGQEPNFSEGFRQQEDFIKIHRKEAKLKTGKMPVLMLEIEGPLAKLIESLKINTYNEGACVFAGKLGEQLFSPKFSLIDNSYDPSVGQIGFFDGDGVVRKNDQFPLIDKGRFANLISDLRFGKKFNQASTGNGTRGYNTGVLLGVRGLRVEFGTKTWRDILKDHDQCLVAVLAAGGDSNDLGEYSSPVQFGYVYSKGELVGRAPQLSVKAKVSDYLGKNLIDVSSDSFTPGGKSACVISEMDVMIN